MRNSFLGRRNRITSATSPNSNDNRQEGAGSVGGGRGDSGDRDTTEVAAAAAEAHRQQDDNEDHTNNNTDDVVGAHTAVSSSLRSITDHLMLSDRLEDAEHRLATAESRLATAATALAIVATALGGGPTSRSSTANEMMELIHSNQLSNGGENHHNEAEESPQWGFAPPGEEYRQDDDTTNDYDDNAAARSHSGSSSSSPPPPLEVPPPPIFAAPPPPPQPQLQWLSSLNDSLSSEPPRLFMSYNDFATIDPRPTTRDAASSVSLMDPWFERNARPTNAVRTHSVSSLQSDWEAASRVEDGHDNNTNRHRDDNNHSNNHTTTGASSTSPDYDDESHLSYLPARHPLHVPPFGGTSFAASSAGSFDRTTNTAPTTNAMSTGGTRHPLRELAVMELQQGIVVFPGDSLPLRIKGAWAPYLAQRIEQARLHPSPTNLVQWGVLAKEPTSHYRTGNQRNSSATFTTSPLASGYSPRRESWTRRAMGPRRLSRMSQLLLQELRGWEDDDDADGDNDTNNNTTTNAVNNNNVEGAPSNDINAEVRNVMTARTSNVNSNNNPMDSESSSGTTSQMEPQQAQPIVSGARTGEAQRENDETPRLRSGTPPPPLESRFLLQPARASSETQVGAGSSIAPSSRRRQRANSLEFRWLLGSGNRQTLRMRLRRQRRRQSDPEQQQSSTTTASSSMEYDRDAATVGANDHDVAPNPTDTGLSSILNIRPQMNEGERDNNQGMASMGGLVAQVLSLGVVHPTQRNPLHPLVGPTRGMEDAEPSSELVAPLPRQPIDYDDTMQTEDDNDSMSSSSSMPGLTERRHSSSDSDDSSLPALVPRRAIETDSDDADSMPERASLARRPFSMLSMDIGIEPLADMVMGPFHYSNERPPESSPHTGPDPMIGRIGTVVTAVYTHGDAVSHPNDRPLQSSQVWTRHGPEVVVTALGTSRFRILRALESERGGRGREEVKRYLVEELTEDDLTPHLLQSVRCNNINQRLAQQTPLPDFVWRRMWPESLASEIRRALERIPAYQSLLSSMNSETHRPLQLGYWLASNMALRQEDKLHLLQISPVERLQWILRKVLESDENDSVIQCKQCECPLARATHAFTVGGCHGTTGNYVNEYGHVHQTITIREINLDDVDFSGRAETRDSWFPGYSWTIMSCALCYAHLGWKFQLVGTAPGTDDRPSTFYGLSTAQVTTVVTHRARHQQRRRRPGSYRH